MYNKVILVGNLIRDIEIKYSQSGMAIAKTMHKATNLHNLFNNNHLTKHIILQK